MGVGYTKTPSSYRRISIPDSVIELLEEYKLGYDGQKNSVVNCGKNLIGYLYNMMAKLCILIQEVNGLLNLFKR